MNIGIVGAGAIGGFLLAELAPDPDFHIVGVAELDTELAKKVLAGLGLSESLIMPFEEFPDETGLYIEAASASIARKVAIHALERGKTAIIASIGGLGDLESLREIAVKSGGRLLLPSGAVAGLDALKAIPKESITRVVLTTTKPVKALGSDPYVVAKGIKAEEITEATKIFEGSAREAAAAFPRSANVAAAVGYASMGLDKVEVQIWIDPDSDRNRHTLRVESGHGMIVAGASNVPFEINPRTSKLAAYSILASIRGLAKPIIIGT
jgi:aspartate dehydrogenase